MSRKYRSPEADGPSPNESDDYATDGTAESLRTLGFETWRPTSATRKMELLARHPDGTIARIHRDKRLTFELDCSNCDRPNGVPSPKPVFVELRRRRNWRLTIWYWAILCRANCQWEIYVLNFRAVARVRRAIRRLRFRYKMPVRVVKLKPIYTEPPTNEPEWRGWGL